MNRLMPSVFVLSVVLPFAFTGGAFAQIADNMTCQQAVAYYESYGRISKITSGNQTIPIYDGVPVSQRSTLRCSTASVYLKTLDNPRCTIAYKCAPFFGGR